MEFTHRASFFLALVVLVASEAPYPPSGYKPSGRLLLLPSRLQAEQTYGPPPQAYGPPQPTSTTAAPTTEPATAETPTTDLPEDASGSQPSEQLKDEDNGLYYILLPDGRLQRVEYKTSPIVKEEDKQEASSAFKQQNKQDQQFQNGQYQNQNTQDSQFQYQQFQNQQFQNSQQKQFQAQRYQQFQNGQQKPFQDQRYQQFQNGQQNQIQSQRTDRIQSQQLQKADNQFEEQQGRILQHAAFQADLKLGQIRQYPSESSDAQNVQNQNAKQNKYQEKTAYNQFTSASSYNQQFQSRPNAAPEQQSNAKYFQPNQPSASSQLQQFQNRPNTAPVQQSNAKYFQPNQPSASSQLQQFQPQGMQYYQLQAQQQQVEQPVMVNGFVANVQYTDVEPISAPIYAYNPAPLVRILKK